MKSAFISLLLLAIPTALASNHGNRLTRKHQARSAHAQIDKELIAKRSNLEVRDEHNHTLTKRAFSGRGTFYYTDVGLGACGELLWDIRWPKDVLTQFSSFTIAQIHYALIQSLLFLTALPSHRSTIAEQ